jgi:hypothetical protein
MSCGAWLTRHLASRVPRHVVAACFAIVVCGVPVLDAFGADRISGFNETTSTAFTEVYLRPQGSATWGPNLALNDKDKVWDSGERLSITGLSPGIFDLKVIDRSGQTCIKRGLDLTRDRTFELRDVDLGGGCATKHPS